MRRFGLFVKKECMEAARSGRLLVLTIVFILFGIMNPAIAKLTPWMMETLSGSLREAGLIVTEVRVDALTSWAQFYKNVPMAMIVFLLLFGGIMASEYQKGTLIPILTKGMPRSGIVLAKAGCMWIFWTALYWLCYGITFFYNAYFWDNGIAVHLFFSAFCIWLLGVWLISLVIFTAVCFFGAQAAVVSAGGIFLIFYVLGLFPDVKNFLPVRLLDASQLCVGLGEPSDYLKAVIVTLGLIAADVAGAVLCFNKRSV